MNLDIFDQIQAANHENTILPTNQQKKESNLYCPNKIVQIQSVQSNSNKHLLSKQDHADPIHTIKLQQTSIVQARSCRSNPHNQAPTNRMVTDFIAPMQPYP